MKRRKPLKAVVATVLIFLLGMQLAVASTDRRVVRVAFPIQPDMTEIRPDGSYSGYIYEYLEKISQLTGWDMEYVVIDGKSLDENLSRALQMIRSGEVDIVGGLVKTPDLEQQYAFCSNSNGIMYHALATTESNLQLNSSNFMSQSPLRVGLWGNADNTMAALESFFNSYGIEHRYRFYADYQDMLEAFQAGEVDVIPDSTIGSVKGSQQIAIYSSKPFYFAGPKGSESFIAELDNAIDRLNLSFPFYQIDLMQKYSNNTRGDFFMTEEEQTYVKEKQVVRALCVDNYAPFVFINKQGQWDGIGVSIMEDFAQLTGMQMEYVKFDRSIDFVTAFGNGEYDCILGIPVNATYNNTAGVITSTPYLTTQQVYFSKYNMPEKPLAERRVGTLKGSDLEKTLKCKEIVYYDTIEQCINAVMAGDIDCGYGNQYCVEYYVQHNFYSMTIIPLVSEQRNMEISVNKLEDPAFLSLLNRYLDHLDNNRIYEFHMQANAANQHSWLKVLTLSDPLLFALLLGAFLFCICFGVAMFVFATASHRKSKQLLVASQAKSDFLSRVSHDMRTPMNAILSFSSMALEKDSTKEQLIADMQQVNHSGQYLLGLINDVLDMSKMESRKMVLNLQPVDPEQTLQAILSTIKPMMDEKHITFKVSRNTPADSNYIMLDVMRTKQLFINLLANAAKFTPPNGTVIFDIATKSLSKTHICLEFTIADTGIGMSEEFQKHLYEPFAQENRTVSGELSGTGLGLSIVKQLVDLMGGTISIKSNVGEGTCVTIDLCHELVEAPPQPQASQPDGSSIPSDAVLHGKRALICEDHPVNMAILKRLLQGKGIAADGAADGKAGLELFHGSGDHYYDWIIMDIRMPVMDGMETAQAIRNLTRSDAKTIPIIAVTANAFQEDIDKALQAGMNAHLAKPIDPTRLFELLVQLLQGGTTT